MPGADLSLDRGDLAAATLDSRSLLLTFLSDLFERSPVALQRGFFAGQCLPALQDAVNVLRIQFNAAADAIRLFDGRNCGAAAEEIEDQLTAFSDGSGSPGASARPVFEWGGRTSPHPTRP